MFEDACPKLHNIDSKNSNFLEHSRSFFFTFVTSFSLSKKLRDRANGEIWTAALMYRKPFLYQLRHNHSAKISSIKELILAAPLKSFFLSKCDRNFLNEKEFSFFYTNVLLKNQLLGCFATGVLISSLVGGNSNWSNNSHHFCHSEIFLHDYLISVEWSVAQLPRLRFLLSTIRFY